MLIVQLEKNKPGTTKFGAISKAQKAQSFQNGKRVPLGFLKLQFLAKDGKN